MYIISYDIEKDKVRNKIAKELANYGQRVQYSVFECRISFKQYQELYGKLLVLMEEEDEGSILFYHLCKNCEENKVIMGNSNKGNGNNGDGVIVI